MVYAAKQSIFGVSVTVYMDFHVSACMLRKQHTYLLLVYSTADSGIISCNRVAACGATFHEQCLTSLHYDIQAQDGCIKCKVSSRFVAKQKSTADAQPSELKSSMGSGEGHREADDDDDDDDDDVIIID